MRTTLIVLRNHPAARPDDCSFENPDMITRQGLTRTGMAAGMVAALIFQTLGCGPQMRRAPREGQDPAAIPRTAVAGESLRRMIEKADFETCVFATQPPWAPYGQIADVLDLASLFRRMFIIAYRAEDARHVVLARLSQISRK